MNFANITFELSDVMAFFMRASLFDRSTGWEIPCNISQDFNAADWNDSDICIGWIPSERGTHNANKYSSSI